MMMREWSEASFHWNYTVGDIFGLLLVAVVIGLHSPMLAITQRPGRGWLVTACVYFSIMAAFISTSPAQSRLATAQIAEVRR
ncbi:hypothetical protein [Sphingopyxis terrae]|uniref:hypothetical protein n=1 Tax=Sphingopyxis terrae TaxID=33052 RepID=UPI00078806A8|nr:hypothetical protein [Sphingopyxis terrae]